MIMFLLDYGMPNIGFPLAVLRRGGALNNAGLNIISTTIVEIYVN